MQDYKIPNLQTVTYKTQINQHISSWAVMAATTALPQLASCQKAELIVGQISSCVTFTNTAVTRVLRCPI